MDDSLRGEAFLAIEDRTSMCNCGVSQRHGECGRYKCGPKEDFDASFELAMLKIYLYCSNQRL